MSKCLCFECNTKECCFLSAFNGFKVCKKCKSILPKNNSEWQKWGLKNEQ